MAKQSRWTRIILGTVLVLVLALGIGAAAYAQTSGGDDAAAETDSTTPETDADTTTPDVTTPYTDRHGRDGFATGSSNDEALAAALGITVEELQAAEEEAFAAAVAQAVTDGLITQEQADQILANGMGPRGFHFGAGDEHDTFLADALGITVEALQAALTQVYADQLAAMVEAGTITQEQADLMLAQKAVQNYIDPTAVQSAMQAIYEEALAQAVADGVITQAQADLLLSNLSTRGFGFPGMDGGFGGGHHGRGHGGPHGFGGPGDMDGSGWPVAPTTTDSSGA